MPDPESVSEEERPGFDAIIERTRNIGGLVDGKVPGYYGALMNAPGMAYHVNQLGRLVRLAGTREGSYSHADREWVDQVLSADWNSNTVLVMHIPDALTVGVRLEAIQALRAGREDELTEDEQLLTAFIRGVGSGTVTDELWDRMTERLGERGVTEYAIFVMFLTLTIRLIEATTGATGPSNEEVDRILEEYKSGERQVPTLEEAEARAG